MTWFQLIWYWPATPGEFCVLVGPSGCGKSTLLRMIAGLEDVSEGTVQIGGRDITEKDPRDRDIAMVFQNYALYPHMTVAENMSFSLRLAKVSKDKIEAAVDHAARILSLTDLLNRYPRQLSGGQRQRVAMGRAIVRDPALFLFDEPLSNLDAKLRVEMRAQIKELHQRLGSTMVYVTHDQIEAMTMADRIVVMQDGQIEQIGTPQQLYDTPQNLFVASFIGSPKMNLIPGAIDTADAAIFVTEQGDRIKVRACADDMKGRSAVLGCRPEHMIVGSGDITAKAVVSEFTGPETHLIARYGDLDLTIVRQERVFERPGDAVSLTLPYDRLVVFDAPTGLACNLVPYRR